MYKKKTKRVLILMLFLLLSKNAICQEQNKCIEIVDLIFKSIEQKNTDLIVPYFSEDFTMANQKMPISKDIYEQLAKSLEVENYELSEITSKKPLTIEYNVFYKNIGKKRVKVVFNDKNLIEYLELIPIEAKVLYKDEAKITYNPNNYIKIPFQKVDNVIIVKAKVNGIERNFILDSGSPYTLINSHYLKTNTNKTISDLTGATGNTTKGLDIIDNFDIDFYGIKSVNQKTLTMDISHLIEEIEIYGLIGYNFIKNYDILFDYENNMITLIKPSYFEKYKKENLTKYTKEVIIPLTMKGHTPILDIRISDSNYSMGLDSGASANLMNEGYFSKIEPHLKKIEYDSITGISNIKKLSKSGILKKMDISGINYKDTKMVFSNIDHLNENKKQIIDGIIGYEILSKQPTLLSYKRNELILFR